MTEDGALPRLVATDLDGTLVHSDGSVSPRTREVLAALDARGVPVVFVTGRPLRWTEEVFEHVGGHGLAVVSNGALVWDVPRDEVYLERLMPPANLLWALRASTFKFKIDASSCLNSLRSLPTSSQAPP